MLLKLRSLKTNGWGWGGGGDRGEEKGRKRMMNFCLACQITCVDLLLNLSGKDSWVVLAGGKGRQTYWGVYEASKLRTSSFFGVRNGSTYYYFYYYCYISNEILMSHIPRENSRDLNMLVKKNKGKYILKQGFWHFEAGFI